MFCRVCGDTNGVQYRERSRMALCGACHKDTPAKATRDEFERVYWGGKAGEVPLPIRNEFWDDYRTSSYGPVAEYVEATTSAVM